MQQHVLVQQVRERAYALWQAEGMIDGRHLDHWRAAESEVVVRGEAAPTRRRPRKSSKSAPPRG
jgi:hypothetical protein